MRAPRYAWSLLVTWQRWRSHDSIRHIWKPMLYAKFKALCFIEPELLPIEVLHCENIDLRAFFAPVTLTLTRWPSYTNMTRIPKRYTGFAKMNFLCQCFRKLSSDRHIDRQRDRQTDTTELYITRFRVWSMKFAEKTASSRETDRYYHKTLCHI